MASYTFYGVTADGFIESRSASWSSVQAGASLNAQPTDPADLVGKFFQSGVYGVNQAFIGFDTSSLPDDSVVSAAVLSLYANGAFGALGWDLQAKAFNWGASLTTADWRSVSQWNALTLLGSISASDIAADAYSALTSYGSNFADHINKSGTTYLMLCTDHWTGIAPAGLSYAIIHFGDQSGTSKDPRLEVTTFEPPAFTPYAVWIA